MSPEMNPIEHVWDFIGRKIHQRNPQVQLTVKGKTTPDSYTPIPKNSCAQNVVVLK
jgi:transposase